MGIEKDEKQQIMEKIDDKLKSLTVPEYAMKVIKEEQTKLSFLDPHSSEFSVCRCLILTLFLNLENFLETIWNGSLAFHGAKHLKRIWI